MRLVKTVFVVCALLLITGTPAAGQATRPCARANRVVTADIAAINQVIMLNRLGASIPMGMMFVLKSDLKADGTLRADKRPRPLVLRVNQGDCLQITLTNMLGPTAKPGQPSTRNTSLHINGMQLYSIADDGSWVGANTSSLANAVEAGQTRKYSLYATEQGTFLLYAAAAPWTSTGNNDGGQQTVGLFGALHVEPPDAEWYRSQVTKADLDAATVNGRIDYDAMRGGKPILKMYTSSNDDKRRTIVHSDLTAVITGKGRQKFNPNLNWCNDPNGTPCSNMANTNPNFQPNYAEPRRTDPYREFTIIYHELFDVVQAFPQFYDTNIGSQTGWNTLGAVQDQFAINYGTGGIGAEIIANRIGVGPMGGCPDCKYEEFFLDSWTVGDPAMIVDTFANQWTSTSMTMPPLPECTPEELLSIQQKIAASPPQPVPLCSMTTGALNSDNIMIPVRKATKTLYPDDPSNVYHSYLNDHVKFRVLHGGTGFSHVHHQHAHQWLRTPNNNESTYLDSQLINPGSAYTLEITFGGAGNRNNTPGDSIFHCHFYPHFAGGMWSLWRVHDTFEPGTSLNANGIPTGDYPRALPDAEILTGTPTPAIVPLPTRPMAPPPARVKLVQVTDPGNPSNVIGTRAELHPDDLKARKNPGFPFFIPGIAGVRAPHPPMDFAVEDGAELNGGLPRHLVITGTVANNQLTRYDFSKDLGTINAFRLPEQGTEIERIAMDYHSRCNHATTTPEGTAAQFETNGLPPAPGAPYADPALRPFNPNFPPPGDERCKAVAPKDWRHYRAAAFQTDLVFNKQGWHFPQSRILALWEDVTRTLSGDRPPEPLFFRTDSDDATEYWHTNLVPDYYLLDDFQVRTPTDIIGQHIHLVKFDVTSSDGAANGFNYEDGTFSPDEVRSRITSITSCGGLLLSDPSNLKPCNQGRRETLVAQKPPASICDGTAQKPCNPDWTGAQTTVQRWMADPLESPWNAGQPGVKGMDRTLRTVFTHDHFGPSTHQQTGLYAAFLIEPADTEWFTNEEGVKMYTRRDGGPTSWQAVIQPKPGTPSTERNTFREFAIALQDFQLTYANTSRSTPAQPINCNPPANTNCEWADTTNVLNQSNLGAPYSMTNMSQQTVSAGPTQGTYTFNYRNEPLPYRLQLPAATDIATKVDRRATDPSYVFSSAVHPRVNPTANPQPKGDQPISSGSAFKFPKKPLSYDMRDGDPYTPLLRAYENDNVQIRTIVGAHMLPHPFTVQGIKWLFEPADELVDDPAANSGYRSTQSMGISEHFEFVFRVPKSARQRIGFTDFLYMPDSANPPNTAPANNNGGGRGIVDGMWGLMRTYQTLQPAERPLKPLPNNPPATTATPAAADSSKPWWWTPTNCTAGNTKQFTVYANNASINYNPRVGMTWNTALVYSLTPQSGTTLANEPLLLRANAGDCIEVTLVNNFDPASPAFDGTTNFSGYSSNSAFNNVAGSEGNAPLPQFKFPPSLRVGLNPALLSYDVATSSGTNIGWNATEATVPATTTSQRSSRTYHWYAGDIANDGKPTPIEFGAVNITPSDPIQQDTYGLVAGLIVEPPGHIFCPDPPATPGAPQSQAQGNVYSGGDCAKPGPFRYRELVLVAQDNVGMLTDSKGDNNIQVALNYRSEPLSDRYPNNTPPSDLSNALSNSVIACPTSPCSTPPACTGTGCDPQTPVLTAVAGDPVRLHLLHPGGSSDQQVLVVHGHLWQDEPYTNRSRALGTNPESQWIGQRDLFGANMSYSLLIASAGGANKVPGDYLYRTHPSNFFSQGMWGIFRVTPRPPTATTGAKPASGGN